MDKKIFSLDRLEGELAVCVSDDDDEMVVPADTLGELKTRDVFSARIEGEALVDIEPMPEERDRRLALDRARLHALATKTKRNKRKL